MTAVQTRTEWLTARRQGIGASDAATLVGLNRWGSLYDLWLDKSGNPAAGHDTDPMEFGRRAEPMLAAWFEDATGIKVDGAQLVCHHKDYPHHMCTLDGHGWDGYLEGGIVEFKTTADTPAAWDTDGIPPYYQCQGQWQMHVTGAHVVRFGVLHLAFGRPTFRVYTLDRDEADIALLVAAAETFWWDHVVAGVAPAVDAKDATTAALNRRWITDGSTREASPDEIQILGRITELKTVTAPVDTELDELRNRLRASMGECAALTTFDTLTGRTVNVATWRADNDFDADGFAAAHPELWATYQRFDRAGCGRASAANRRALAAHTTPSTTARTLRVS
jgi:putative phage-type endonuclease